MGILDGHVDVSAVDGDVDEPFWGDGVWRRRVVDALHGSGRRRNQRRRWVAYGALGPRSRRSLDHGYNWGEGTGRRRGRRERRKRKMREQRKRKMCGTLHTRQAEVARWEGASRKLLFT